MLEMCFVQAHITNTLVQIAMELRAPLHMHAREQQCALAVIRHN